MDKSHTALPPPVLQATLLIQWHDSRLGGAAPSVNGAATRPVGLWRRIEANHRCNTLLWQEEDRARRTDVPAAQIVASKRLIDQANQARNDAVEQIDAILLTLFTGIPRQKDARLHSETPGAMIDRLSILALKIFHMRLQTLRSDAEAIHLARCAEKLQCLILQRKDLATCLDGLLTAIQTGRAYFKTYRQFKMYNDPSMHPYPAKK